MTENVVLYEFTFPSIHRELIRFMDFFLFPFMLAPIAVLGFIYLRTGKNLMHNVGYLTNILVYLVVRLWVVRSELFTSPTKVKVTEEMLVWERGVYRKERSLKNLKRVYFSLSDRKFLLKAIHSEPVDGRNQWVILFTSYFTLGSGDKFREFYTKTYPEFKIFLEERVRQLNPGVKIEVKDKRKRFRG